MTKRKFFNSHRHSLRHTHTKFYETFVLDCLYCVAFKNLCSPINGR